MTVIYPPFDSPQNDRRTAYTAYDAQDPFAPRESDPAASPDADAFAPKASFDHANGFAPSCADSYRRGADLFQAASRPCTKAYPYDDSAYQTDGFDAPAYDDPFSGQNAWRSPAHDDAYVPSAAAWEQTQERDVFASHRMPARRQAYDMHDGMQNTPYAFEQSINTSLEPYAYEEPPLTSESMQQTRPMLPARAHTDAARRVSAPPARGQRANEQKRKVIRKRRSGGGSKVALIFFILLFVASVIMLGVLLVPRFLARSEYISLSPQMLSGETSQSSALSSLFGESEQTDDGDAQMLTAELLAYYEQTNPDFIGWIDVPDTQIHYPIVRGTDNDYYLTHTFKKASSSYGAIFVDYSCADNLSDANTVIYGHNMRNGSMFHDLTRMLDASYLAAHDTFTITASDAQVYTYRIFSVYEVSVTTDYRTVHLEQNDSRTQYFKTLRSYSAVAAQDVSFSADSRIVTFSTCPNDSDDNYRIAVHAILEDVQPLS